MGNMLLRCYPYMNLHGNHDVIISLATMMSSSPWQPWCHHLRGNHDVIISWQPWCHHLRGNHDVISQPLMFSPWQLWHRHNTLPGWTSQVHCQFAMMRNMQDSPDHRLSFHPREKSKNKQILHACINKIYRWVGITKGICWQNPS